MSILSYLLIPHAMAYWPAPLSINFDDIQSDLLDMLIDDSSYIDASTQTDEGLPIVLSHGMGDGCATSEMQTVMRFIAAKKTQYVMCIGDHGTATHDVSTPWTDVVRDIVDGYFSDLNTAVDYFAEQVKANPNLNDGFNAMGFSQGNLILRGYIERYNSPPVNNFVSVHGPMLGVGGLPKCDPVKHPYCRTIFKYASYVSYTAFAQSHVFQADYVRNPLLIPDYLKTVFLPDLNNEISDEISTKKGTQQSYFDNFTSLNKLILVKANKEQMVIPSESSWFGFYQDGNYDKIERYYETKLYQADAFGLKTLDDRDAIIFVETGGGHCELSGTEFDYLISYL